MNKTTKPVRLNTTSVETMESTLYTLALAHVAHSESAGLEEAREALSRNPDDFYDYFSEAARLSCTRHEISADDWENKPFEDIVEELTFGQTSKTGEYPHIVWAVMENTIGILYDSTLSDPWQRVMCFGDPANMVEPLMNMGALFGAFATWNNPEDVDHSFLELIRNLTDEATAAYKRKRGL